MEVIGRGNSKQVLRCDEQTLAFRFTDEFSVFGAPPSKQLIPGKGQAICKAAVKSFEIARRLEIETHFIEQLDENTIRICEVMVIRDRPLNRFETNCLLPLEWICRYYLAGSLLDKIKNSLLSPWKFGCFGKDIYEGKQLYWPVCHLTTKFEKVDRDLTENEAMALAQISPAEMNRIWQICLRLDGAISLAYRKAGFTYFDGKKEISLVGVNRRVVMADTFGTQDEDRPVLTSDLSRNKVSHYGREYIRQYFREIGYEKRLNQARQAGLPDPEYPEIPEKILEEIALRYAEFAKRYSAVDL